MTVYRITYLDKYQKQHSVDVPAYDPESAIVALEDGLSEKVEITKIEILDD